MINDLPRDDVLISMAQRVIWFEDPEIALSNPVRFLAYAMTYATPADMRTLRTYIHDDKFQGALDALPPGIVDPRSWAYWNLKMGRFPAPPMPVRSIKDV